MKKLFVVLFIFALFILGYFLFIKKDNSVDLESDYKIREVLKSNERVWSGVLPCVDCEGILVSLVLSDFNSEKEFEYKILNSLGFENIRDFFIKKTIIDAVREKHNSSNGSNGVTTVDLLNLFKWKDIDIYINELVQKKIIQKKQGISLEMYFIYKK